jgi:hypothetical protein
MIIGSSVITPRPIASPFRQMPGPLLAVTAMSPANAAPQTDDMAAISSSAWNVRTPKCFMSASVSRIPLAGVIG